MSDKLMELTGRDRPILFSTPMVRALLDGRKTQTRRALKPQPYDFAHPNDGHRCWNASGVPGGRICVSDRDLLGLHKWRVADRLWVREACWIAPPYWTDSPVNPMGPHRQETAYAADDRSGYTRDAAADYKLKLRPSIHMPRWASRLTLLVDDVRIERLQDISEEDAVAEGIAEYPCEGPYRGAGATYWAAERGHPEHGARTSPIAAYRALWETINRPGSWDANPWVAAISFRVFRQNIDSLRALASKGGAE